MNYLVAQDAMIERLREKLPAAVPVRAALDLAQVKDQSTGQPEVWVFFARDIPADQSRNRTLLNQQWAVVYVAPGLLPDMSRDGNALYTVLKALAGYDADIDGMGTFERAGSMVPQCWVGAGLTAYGQLFSVSLDL